MTIVHCLPSLTCKGSNAQASFKPLKRLNLLWTRLLGEEQFLHWRVIVSWLQSRIFGYLQGSHLRPKNGRPYLCKTLLRSSPLVSATSGNFAIHSKGLQASMTAREFKNNFESG